MESKKIKGYENYLIYDNGDVVNTITNKQLNGSIGEGGYKYYRLSIDNKKKMFYAHRLVAEHFIDNPEKLPVVNHKDGDKLNNNVENLEWVSYSENTQHAHDTGLIKARKQKEVYDKDLDGEVWKEIPNYHNYKISSKGRVLNINTNTILSPSLTCGYLKVRLSEKGIIKDLMIHKLVYSIFNDVSYDIKEGYTIDHIDGNKQNNALDNLRLISLSENVLAGLYEQKTNKTCKLVYQYTLDGKLINTFPSTKEAGRQLNLDASSISKVCRGVVQTCGGFKFSYEKHE